MKWFAFLVLLLLVGANLTAGCAEACQYLHIGCDDVYSTVYISKDPQACKSIKIDCTQYGFKGQAVQGESMTTYLPFSDSTGCGCWAQLRQ